MGSPVSVTVTAEDPYGNVDTTYAGAQPVVFSGPSGSPDATAPIYPTDVSFSAGVATASVTLVDAQVTELIATEGAVVGVSNTVTIEPSTTSALTLTGFPSPTTAGVTHTLTVTAVDSFGNTTPSYAGNVLLSSSDPQAVLPPAAEASGGVIVFSAELKTPGAETITATDTAAGSIAGTSSTITVQPAAAVLFIVDAPASATVGSSIVVTMTAEDPFGNVVTSYAGSKTVVFSGPSSSPDATAADYPGTVSFSAGVGTASVTLADAQPTTLTATQGSVSGTSDTIAVSPASASQFGVAVSPAVTAGNLISVTVTAEDPFGNLDTSYSGSRSVVFSGPSSSPNATSPGYPVTVGFSAGVGTASVTLPDAQSTTLTATQGSVSGTSGTISVAAAAASRFVVNAPASATVGAVLTVAITAEDPYGNLATAYVGSPTVLFTGPSSSPDATAPGYPTSVSFSAGVGTASVTLPDAQSTTITATQGSISGTSDTIALVPGTTARLTVTGFPSPTIAGASHTFTVAAVDSFGNSTPSYAGTVRLSSSDGSASLSDEQALTGGAGLFSAALRTEGAQTISATDTVAGSITGTSSTIEVEPTAADQFALSTVAKATAGRSIGVIVTVEDPFGNHDPTYTGVETVVFTGPSSSPDGTAPTYPASVSFTAGVGIASVTLPDAQSTASSVTQGSITGTSGTITVVAAASSRFVLATPTSVIAGTSAGVTITTEDPFGNLDTSYAGSRDIVFTGAVAIAERHRPGLCLHRELLRRCRHDLREAHRCPAHKAHRHSGPGLGHLAVQSASHLPRRATSPCSAPAHAVVGSSTRVTLAAEDRYGNVATSFAGSLIVVFTGPSASPNATAPSYRHAVDFSAGTGTTAATFDRCREDQAQRRLWLDHRHLGHDHRRTGRGEQPRREQRLTGRGGQTGQRDRHGRRPVREPRRVIPGDRSLHLERPVGDAARRQPPDERRQDLQARAEDVGGPDDHRDRHRRPGSHGNLGRDLGERRPGGAEAPAGLGRSGRSVAQVGTVESRRRRADHGLRHLPGQACR